MEVDNRRQRTTLHLNTGPTSKGVRQPDGKLEFPMAGTVLGQDFHSSVGPTIARLKEQKDFPFTVFIPAQRRPDGRTFRPGGGSCWIKGCQQSHNWASCPKLIDYRRHHPRLHVPMSEPVRHCEQVLTMTGDSNHCILLSSLTLHLLMHWHTLL